MNTKPGTRNAGFDFLKYICAFMVVCLHTKYAGEAFFEPFNRMAVPIFAMISGYYYASMKQRGRVKQQIIGSLKLLLLSNLLYFGWKFSEALLQGNTAQEYFAIICTPKVLWEFLLFNHSPFSYHLWYLGSHLYTLTVIYLFEKKWDRKKLYPLIPVLLLINLALGNYSRTLFSQALNSIYSRNFLFLGIPFFLLGDYFRQSGTRLRAGTLAAGMLLSAILTGCEKRYLMSLPQPVNTDLYLGSILLACFVFLFFSQNRPAFSCKPFQAVAFMGRHLSSTIYIVHLIFISIGNKTIYAPRFWGTGYPELYEKISNLVILAVSTAFAFIVYRIRTSGKPKRP